MSLHFTDPTSFKIPAIASAGIIGLLILLLTNQWIGEQDRVVKVPEHIAARIVQVNKPKPKAAPVKKTVKKKAPPKKVKAKPKSKPKPKPIIKPKPKPKVNQDAKPEPVTPLPGMDFLDALEKEEVEQAEAEAKRKEEAAKQAEYEAEQTSNYISQITALIQSVWRFPPSAKHDEEVTLRIYLVPTGEVTEVVLLDSSGNPALDRSAEQAVWKVATFPVPEDLAIFEKKFRQFVLKLKPENARL